MKVNSIPSVLPSSTSIRLHWEGHSAAKLKWEVAYSIAVIGDGAITGGMAFEALNNVGVYDDHQPCWLF